MRRTHALFAACVSGLVICLFGAPLSAEPRAVARWYGELYEWRQYYATREPGGFGLSLSAPNAVKETRTQVVLREEIEGANAKRRTIVERLSFSCNVNDLYYLNKDGSRVGAGAGGSVQRSLSEQELGGARSPLASADATSSTDQRTGKEIVSVSFGFSKQEALAFPVDVIPLKLVGFNTVLNDQYQPTMYHAGVLGFSKTGELTNGRVTLSHQDEGAKGEPGLIGGGKWKVKATFRRVPQIEGLELVVRLKDYDKWIPQANADEKTPGNHLLVHAELRGKDGGPPTRKATKITFQLRETSREPGVAINWPPKDRAARDDDGGYYHDLRFHDEFNFYLHEGVAVVDGTQEQKAETPPGGERTEAEANISAHDWGGYGMLRVTAELPEGQVVGHLEGDPSRQDIPIPKRRDHSKIPDALKQGDLASLSDDYDGENDPVGNRFKGDGLTFYEEYRGFYEAGEHHRADPHKKDLFLQIAPEVRNRATLEGIKLFENATGLHVHYKLRPDEIDKDRVINFNHDAAPHRVDQHAVRLIKGDSGDLDASFAQIHSDRGAGVPREVDYILIDSTANPRHEQSVARGGGTEVINVYSAVIAHELGHAVNIPHHGEGDERRKAWTNDRQADGSFILKEDGVRIKVLDEKTIKEHVFPTLGDKTYTFTVYLGKRGGQHSGAEECFMRYYCADAYRSDAHPATRYWVKGDEIGGYGLCTSSDGTGVNAAGRKPQPRWGDASIGNCARRICVNDAFVPKK